MVEIRILGCGTSAGVPGIGFGYGACDPDEVRNRRLRSSILVSDGGMNILVDTSPDCREQLLVAGVDSLAGVLYTHAHADHCHGIDDLRWVCLSQGSEIPIYGSLETISELRERFGYVFESLDDRACGYYYKPVLVDNIIDKAFKIGNLEVVPFEQGHGDIITMGYRIGNFAYSTDVVDLDDRAFSVLSGVRVWVVDALQYKAHPTHSHVEKTLGWIRRLGVERAYLTHMSQFLDYGTLVGELPENVEPAYDNLVIKCD